MRIQARIKQFRAQVEETSSGYDSDGLQERVAKRAGGLAVIQVGAATVIELKEKGPIADPCGFERAFSGRVGSSLANQLAAGRVAVAAGAALRNTSPVFGSGLDVAPTSWAGRPVPLRRPDHDASCRVTKACGACAERVRAVTLGQATPRQHKGSGIKDDRD